MQNDASVECFFVILLHSGGVPMVNRIIYVTQIMSCFRLCYAMYIKGKDLIENSILSDLPSVLFISKSKPETLPNNRYRDTYHTVILYTYIFFTFFCFHNISFLLC